MHERLLEILRCPESGSRLHIEKGDVVSGEIESGTLVAAMGGKRYPILRGIPRFVAAGNYAASFGLQWNRFKETQLDSRSGLPISSERFFRFTRWKREDLQGTWVLDAGCGAGRFAEVALAAGAQVVAIDYSDAVDACRANLGSHPRLHAVQADIYRLPFAPGTFPRVYSLGVLQHTPNVRAAFLALAPQLAPGGWLVVDLYPKLWLNALWPKYWLRPLTKRLSPERLMRVVEAAVPLLLPLSHLIGRLPRFGRKLRYAVPVANYEGVYPLAPSQLREWAVLDTFDMFAPAYDHPQSAKDLQQWFCEAGLAAVEVERLGFLVGRGRRPTVNA